MQRKSARQIILEILRAHPGKRYSYNDVIHAIITYCKDKNIDEPKFNTIERTLRKLSSGHKKKINSDGGGYFWERLKDDSSAKLDQFLGGDKG